MSLNQQFLFFKLELTLQVLTLLNSSNYGKLKLKSAQLYSIKTGCPNFCNAFCSLMETHPRKKKKGGGIDNLALATPVS